MGGSEEEKGKRGGGVGGGLHTTYHIQKERGKSVAVAPPPSFTQHTEEGCLDLCTLEGLHGVCTKVWTGPPDCFPKINHNVVRPREIF